LLHLDLKIQMIGGHERHESLALLDTGSPY
jgi:hypothetical protein